MRSDVERRDMLVEAGLALSSELSLDSVLQRIVELAVQVTEATYGALGVLGPDGTISRLITTGIDEEQRRRIGHVPVGRGILGVLIHEARPLRLHNIQSDPARWDFLPTIPPCARFSVCRSRLGARCSATST